jgi:hypothetical protein
MPVAGQTRAHSRSGGGVATLTIAIGHFSFAAKCAVWQAAANSTTCPSRWEFCIVLLNTQCEEVPMK